jgi:hypothetical protein
VPRASVALEAEVEAAIGRVRAAAGKRWLRPPEFGTRLHAEVARALRTQTLPPGWAIEVEQPLSRGGRLSQSGQMTVRQWLRSQGDINRLESSLVRSVLDEHIANIKPDVVLTRPEGARLIWDLTSVSREEHLAKTMLYAQLLAEDNVAVRIMETYWGAFRAR